MSVTKVGDLVWVRVQGHPWWPGQVLQAALDVVYCNHFGYTAAQSDKNLTEIFGAVRCKKVALHTGYGPQENNK